MSVTWSGRDPAGKAVAPQRQLLLRELSLPLREPRNMGTGPGGVLRGIRSFKTVAGAYALAPEAEDLSENLNWLTSHLRPQPASRTLSEVLAPRTRA